MKSEIIIDTLNKLQSIALGCSPEDASIVFTTIIAFAKWVMHDMPDDVRAQTEESSDLIMAGIHKTEGKNQ